MRRYLNITILLCISCLLCNGQVSFSGCYISGALLNPTSTAGCGNSGNNNYCDLASLYVPAFSPTACGTSTSSGGVSHAKATSFVLPAGCTATVEAEFQKRNYLGVGSTSTGCSNSGMDGSGDSFSITSNGGTIVNQSSTINVNVGTCAAYPTLGTYTTAVAQLTTGCNNADGKVYMEVTGGTVTISGNSNRADELITFTLNMSGTCGPSCSAVLPMELITFYAEAGNGVVNLAWKVASEKNVDHYLVEKSFDGINYIPIAKIQSLGDAYSPREYTFADDFPEKGVNYYKLTNSDHDGSRGSPTVLAINYEDVIKSLWIKQDEENLHVFFDPSMKRETLQLLEVTGKILWETELSHANESVVIPKNELKGVYILRSSAGVKPVNIKVILD